MQNIDHLEEMHRKCLDYIDKIKIANILIEEDKAYLKSYDKTAWYLRPPQEYAEAKSITLKNRQQKIEDYERKYKSAMAEIISHVPQKSLVAIAELHSPWI